MKINKITEQPFHARIIVGAQVGYTDEIVSEINLISFIQEYQDRLIKDKNLYLSACLSDCKIILSRQVEPHFQISFINYPRFPLNNEILKKEIEDFTEALMKKFSQNRLVVEFPEETIMFEVSNKIDPRIPCTVKDLLK